MVKKLALFVIVMNFCVACAVGQPDTFEHKHSVHVYGASHSDDVRVVFDGIDLGDGESSITNFCQSLDQLPEKSSVYMFIHDCPRTICGMTAIFAEVFGDRGPDVEDTFANMRGLTLSVKTRRPELE